MKGVGKAFSAVSIINAFATGIGSAMAINLKTLAYVKLKKTGVEGIILVNGRPFKDLRLVEAVVEIFRDFTGKSIGVKFKIISDIPVGKGLKSSSAAANALCEALSRALSLKLSPLKIVELGVEAAKKAGVTVTGAFDDAAASFLGGLVVTDNLRMKILRHESVSGRRVVLLIPKETVLTEELVGADFSGIAPYVEEAVKLALRGEWKRALVINGLLYSAVLGYSLKPVGEALKLGYPAGLSGKGPTLFAIAEDDATKLCRIWSKYGTVKITKTIEKRVQTQ